MIDRQGRTVARINAQKAWCKKVWNQTAERKKQLFPELTARDCSHFAAEMEPLVRQYLRNPNEALAEEIKAIRLRALGCLNMTPPVPPRPVAVAAAWKKVYAAVRANNEKARAAVEKLMQEFETEQALQGNREQGAIMPMAGKDEPAGGEKVVCKKETIDSFGRGCRQCEAAGKSAEKECVATCKTYRACVTGKSADHVFDGRKK